MFNPGPEPVRIEDLSIKPSDGKNWTIHTDGNPGRNLPAASENKWTFSVNAPADAALTRPYFTRPDEEQAYYDLNDERYRNLSFMPYPLSAHAELSYRDVKFAIDQVVETNRKDPRHRNCFRSAADGAAISVAVSPAAGAVPLSSKTLDFTCMLHSNVKGAAQGVLRLQLPAGWKSTPAEAPFSMARDGEDKSVPTFSVTPGQIQAQGYTITAVAEYQGKQYTEGYRLVGYEGLRPLPFYRPATYRVNRRRGHHRARAAHRLPSGNRRRCPARS